MGKVGKVGSSVDRPLGALVLACLLAFGQPAHAERLWLLIGASDPSAAALAKKARWLAPKAAAGLVVQTSDCGEAKNVFAWAGEIAASADAAQAALPRLRRLVPDAYVKRCEARPGSLLAMRIDAIDPSIADVPANAAGWREQDRVSTVQRLEGKLIERIGDPAAAGRSLLVTRYYEAAPNDPLEGRRERISLIDASGKRAMLHPHCMDAGRITVQRGAIALQCAREQAADEVLHSVLVFDAAGRKLADIEHCRNPQWAEKAGAGRAVSCESESVDATGRLLLKRRVVGLPPAGPR